MNYHDLLNIRYRSLNKIIVLLIISVGVFSYIASREIHDVYHTYGYINNKNLVLNVPITNPDTLNKLEYLSIDNKKCSGKEVSVSEIFLDEKNLINYQTVTIKLDKKYPENRVLKVSIYYNKEKVLKKLKKLFL